MANEQNLRPCEYKLSKEDSRKGGIRSGESKRKKKTLKELLEIVAEKGVQNEKVKKTLSDLGFNDEEQTINLAIAVRIMNGALNGDHKSIAEYMDGTGQRITHAINENHNIEYKPLVDLTKMHKDRSEKDVSE